MYEGFFFLTIFLPYLMCMCGCVREQCISSGGGIGQTQTERQSRLNWSVFSLPAAMFISCFFQSVGTALQRKCKWLKLKCFDWMLFFRACGTKHFQFCSSIEILMTCWEHLALNDVLQEHKSDRPHRCPESDYSKQIKWVRCLPPLVFEALNTQSSSSQLRLGWM